MLIIHKGVQKFKKLKGKILLEVFSALTHRNFFLAIWLVIETISKHLEKQRHYFTDKGLPVKAVVFSSSHVWIRQLDHKESWEPKDVFELCCWRRLSRVRWTARRSNQSIWKEISPEYSLEGLMLKLKLQYFGHFMGRADSLEKTDAGRDWGGEGDDRGWDSWMASPTRWTWVWVNSGRWWWTGRPGVLRFMGSQRVRHYWVTELNWVISDVKYLSMFWLAVCKFSLEKYLFKSS